MTVKLVGKSGKCQERKIFMKKSVKVNEKRKIPKKIFMKTRMKINEEDIRENINENQKT